MEEISPKSRLITTLLCILPTLVGIAGIHRFYLGKIATAIVMLFLGPLGIAGFIGGWFILLGTEGESNAGYWMEVIGCISFAAAAIWAFIDFIFAVSGIMKDKEGRVIKNW